MQAGSAGQGSVARGGCRCGSCLDESVPFSESYIRDDEEDSDGDVNLARGSVSSNRLGTISIAPGTFPLGWPIVPAYSLFARAYDSALGVRSFVRVRNAFEALVRCYRIPFRSAADVGSGTGLFARYLSECWRVPVFAVDRSRAMLSVALANCGGADVRLVQQDIRALCLPRPVDLVTANFDTLNHLVRDVDLAMGLRQIFRNLRPGGHLIFDLVTPCQPVGVGRIYSRRLRSATCTALQQVRWDEPRRMLSIVVVLRSPAWRQPVVELHRERAYSPAEIGRHLLDVGFMIRGVHDAATLAPARHCPSRIIVVATRPDGRPLCRAG